MISSILQEVLMPVSFGSLLCLMLLYWGQAALFSYTKYSKLTTVLFCFSFISLTTLLILRWVDSGHFPLSNLYESLLFLSWSFLGIQLVAQLTLISAMPEPALLLADRNVAAPATGQAPTYARPTGRAQVGGRMLSKAEQAPRVGQTDRPCSRSEHSARLQSACSESGPTHSAEMNLARPTRLSLFKFFESKPDFALREVSQRQLLHLLGVITSPMALLTYGFAFLNLPREMQKATALVPALQSNWLMMHVTIMILSYAALLCGSIFSMAFLLLTNIKTASPLLQTVSNPATIAPLRGAPRASLEFADVPTARLRSAVGANRPAAGCSASSSATLKPGWPSAKSKAPVDLKIELLAYGERLRRQLSALPHKELPKLCFGDRLELHDWALRAHTQASRADGRLLGVAEQPKNKATFAQSGSALSQQDLALLNSKARFAGDAITGLWAGLEPKQNLEKAEQALVYSFAEQEVEQEPAIASIGHTSWPKANTLATRAELEFAEQPNGLETPYLSLADRLDNYSYRVLALGFPLLTVGILSGAVWANEAWGSYWSWDPKETWALITWLVFAIYLHARILKGWTGRKPAIIATFGFFVVWFCYLGVNLLGTGLHSYGWFSN